MHAQTICTTKRQRERNSQQRWRQSRRLAAAAVQSTPTTTPARFTQPRRRLSAAAAAAAADTTDESSPSSCDSDSSSASSTNRDEPVASQLQPSLSLPFSVDDDFELSQSAEQQPALSLTDSPAVHQQRQLTVTVVRDSSSSSPVSIRISRVRLLTPLSSQ